MRCDICEWRCELGVDRFGVCRMYYADGGTIRERFPHTWCTYGVAGIEALPFYHALPGSRCLTIGTSSCNFRCRYCANAFIAKRDPAEARTDMLELSPQELVKMARKLDCDAIVFNVNEPAVSLDTLTGLAGEARAWGLPLGCLTNGYTTVEATNRLAGLFSFFNVSLKGLSDRFNRDYIGIPSVAPVLRNLEILAGLRHVEITTPVIQGVNDHELGRMAELIARMDPEIPWHVFRLLPEDEMSGCAYPGIEHINAALEAARGMLAHVYFHNFVGSDWVNTLCSGCGTLLIERFSLGCGGDKLQRMHCVDGACPSCHRELRLMGGGINGDVERVAA